MYVDQFRTASLVGSRFVSNGSGGATLYVPTVRVAQSLFEEQGLTTSLRWSSSGTGSLTVDTTVFRGSGIGVYAYGYYAGRVTVRGSALERGPAGYGGRLLYAYLPGWVQVLDSRVDSTAYGYYAVDVTTDTLDVLNTQMHFVSGGVQASRLYYGGPSLLATVTGTTIGCRTGNSGNYTGLQLTDADAVVTGNTVSGCWTGMNLNSGTPRSATITGNTVTDLDSLNGNAGILLQGAWNQPVVSHNTVARGRMSAGGIYLYAYGYGYGDIDLARVDSNTIQDGRGNGIQLNSSVRDASVRGNTIERMRPIPFASDNAGINVLSGSGPGTVRIVDNRLRLNRTFGMYLNTGAPIRLDTNVVVDDSLFAVKIEAGTTVVGRGNFLARNGDGIYAYGTITIDSSVIQQSTRVGAQYSGGTVTLIDNYWGHISGPRCDTGCVGALGDSIAGAASIAFGPFLPSAPTTPIGAPPALRPSAAFAAPTSALRAQAVEPAWFEQQRRAFAARRGGAR
jgi:hypothetical protein